MYHFINCILLAFAPHVLLYKCTSLGEESGFRSCMSGGIGYAITQIVRMFVQAAILSQHTQEEIGAASSVVKEFDLFEEFGKCVISVIEILGVQLIFQSTSSLAKFSSGTRILAVGVGMSLAESIMKYAIPIFWGARGQEFSWTYLEMACASNVQLFMQLSFVAMVWLRMRTDLNKAAVPIVYAALAGACVLPSVDNYLTLVVGVDSWSILAFHAIIAASLCILAKMLLSSYNTQRMKKQ